LSTTDKVNNNYIKIGGTVFVIPRSFEIGSMFGAIPTLVMDSIRDQSGKELSEGLTQIFQSTFLFNPIPQVVKPLAEVYLNKDFYTMRDIETLADQRRPTEDRADENTSAVARLLGQYAPIPGLSPKKADQLIRGYFGSLGTAFLATVDGIATAAGVGKMSGARPEGYFGDPTSVIGLGAKVSGLDSMVKNPNFLSDKYVKDFYDMKRNATEIVTSITDAQKALDFQSMREKMQANPQAKAVYQRLNAVENQITTINGQMKSIRNNPNMAGAQKTNLLNNLNKRKQMLAEQAVNFGSRLGF
jgi:hypothetical protein